MNSEFEIVRLQDLLTALGEKELKAMFSSFVCPLNTEVTVFLQNSAIEFNKKKIAATHLLLDHQGELAGYFTLTHKVIKIQGDVLSKSKIKKLLRHAKPSDDTFYVSAFLLAQLSKNFAVSSDCSISGSELMERALRVLKKVQKDIGGEIVFLECEEKPKLLEFYCNETNNFFRFGERQADDGKMYVQLMRFI